MKNIRKMSKINPAIYGMEEEKLNNINSQKDKHVNHFSAAMRRISNKRISVWHKAENV